MIEYLEFILRTSNPPSQCSHHRLAPPETAYPVLPPSPIIPQKSPSGQHQTKLGARPASSYVIWALETHFKSSIQFIPHGLFVSAAVTSESWGIGGATYLKRQFREKNQPKWIFSLLPFAVCVSI